MLDQTGRSRTVSNRRDSSPKLKSYDVAYTAVSSHITGAVLGLRIRIDRCRPNTPVYGCYCSIKRRKVSAYVHAHLFRGEAPKKKVTGNGWLPAGSNLDKHPQKPRQIGKHVAQHIPIRFAPAGLKSLGVIRIKGTFSALLF